MWLSCTIFLQRSLFACQQKRCDHWKTLSPSATASGLSSSHLKDKSKKEKTNTTNRDSVQGSKGNQQEKCCFHFFFFFKRRTGCEEDGWMLSFSISIYRWLRCYVMLLQKKEIPLYIYIYKLKIITLMQ